MKKCTLALVFIFPFLAFAQKNATNLTINGTLKNIPDTINMVYASYMNNGTRVMDSAVVTENGKYQFNLSITEPIRVQLMGRNMANKKARLVPKNVAMVFVEPGKVTINNVDSFANINVKGSKAHEEFTKLNTLDKSFNTQMEVLYKEYSNHMKAQDKEAAAKTEAAIDALEAQQKEEVYGTYLKANPNSPLAIYALSQYAGYSIDGDKIEPIFNTLSTENQNTFSGTELKRKIEIAKKTGIGKMAMDFTQNDTLGNPISLSSFKGKYVLVDFWASWCGPCRRENPNVVKVFNQYKDKGFHIIGVSLDQPGAKDRWMKAIHDDKLTWTHVSDLQFWNNEVAKQYGIQSIPQNLLLDPQGKIVAKNLRGETLGIELEKFLGK